MGILKKLMNKVVESQTGLKLENIHVNVDKLDVEATAKKIKEVAENTDWRKVAGDIGYTLQGMAEAAKAGSQWAIEEVNSKNVLLDSNGPIKQIENTTLSIPEIGNQPEKRIDETQRVLTIERPLEGIEETIQSVSLLCDEPVEKKQ